MEQHRKKAPLIPVKTGQGQHQQLTNTLESLRKRRSDGLYSCRLGQSKRRLLFSHTKMSSVILSGVLESTPGIYILFLPTL